MKFLGSVLLKFFIEKLPLPLRESHLLLESEIETTSPLELVSQFTGKSPIASCAKSSVARILVPETKSLAPFILFTPFLESVEFGLLVFFQI